MMDEMRRFSDLSHTLMAPSALADLKANAFITLIDLAFRQSFRQKENSRCFPSVAKPINVLPPKGKEHCRETTAVSYLYVW
jgi:hypothetical protein